MPPVTSRHSVQLGTRTLVSHSGHLLNQKGPRGSLRCCQGPSSTTGEGGLVELRSMSKTWELHLAALGRYRSPPGWGMLVASLRRDRRAPVDTDARVEGRRGAEITCPLRGRCNNGCGGRACPESRWTSRSPTNPWPALCECRAGWLGPLVGLHLRPGPVSSHRVEDSTNQNLAPETAQPRQRGGMPRRTSAMDAQAWAGGFSRGKDRRSIRRNSTHPES